MFLWHNHREGSSTDWLELINTGWSGSPRDRVVLWGWEETCAGVKNRNQSVLKFSSFSPLLLLFNDRPKYGLCCDSDLYGLILMWVKLTLLCPWVPWYLSFFNYITMHFILIILLSQCVLRVKHLGLTWRLPRIYHTKENVCHEE